MSRSARAVLPSAVAAAVGLAIGCGEVAVDGGSSPQERRAQGAADASTPDDGGASPQSPLQLDAAVDRKAATDAGVPPNGGLRDANLTGEDTHGHDGAVDDAGFDDDASLAGCAEGEARCEGMTPYACNDQGVFEPIAPCEEPAWVCQDGACVQKDITTLGLAEVTGAERELAARHLYATRVTTDRAATLRELAVLGLEAGGAVRIALYGDRVVNGESRPGTFIAGGIDRLRITDGAQRTTPRGWHELSAATTYWIVAITSTTPSIVCEGPHAQGSVVSAPWPAGFSFAGSFPQDFPTDQAEGEAALRLSFYLGVQTLDGRANP